MGARQRNGRLSGEGGRHGPMITLAIRPIMPSVSSSMPRLGSARLTLRALSIWPSGGGPARRLRNPSSADEDTNACTNSLNMRQSDFSRNPSRTRPGKRSSVSSTGRRRWPGSRKTGLTLWQESRARADTSAEESSVHKDVGKLIGDEPVEKGGCAALHQVRLKSSNGGPP